MTVSSVPDKVAVHPLLQKGLEVMNKITSQAVSLNKEEMMNLLNFEIAVKYIIDCELKAFTDQAQTPLSSSAS